MRRPCAHFPDPRRLQFRRESGDLLLRAGIGRPVPASVKTGRSRYYMTVSYVGGHHGETHQIQFPERACRGPARFQRRRRRPILLLAAMPRRCHGPKRPCARSRLSSLEYASQQQARPLLDSLLKRKGPLRVCGNLSQCCAFPASENYSRCSADQSTLPETHRRPPKSRPAGMMAGWLPLFRSSIFSVSRSPLRPTTTSSRGFTGFCEVGGGLGKLV